ncbi:hypothetical protein [Haloferula sp. A504]|uniref:hypothetical protein n=1 Tax=Haloferula sp. A504 TaxID=3373601 RepID=UPI0031C0B6CD|nr:hypothetical protein [Verrucomicrobiaceae bacterium E54]
MRITIEIDDALLRALREEAGRKGKLIKRLVEETLQKGLSVSMWGERELIDIEPSPVGVRVPYRAMSMNRLHDDLEARDPT